MSARSEIAAAKLGLVTGLAVLASVRPAAAACARPSHAGDVARAASTGEAAFENMDRDAFQQARAQAEEAIPCLADLVDTAQASAIYRLEALASFLDRDHAKAVGYLRALLAASPGYDLSPDLAPEGHPLRIDFEVAQGTLPAPTKRLDPPRRGAIQVDGLASDQVPTDRPYLFQYADESGKVRVSAMVQPGQEPPSYPVRRSGFGVSLRLDVPLALTAGAAGIASGIAYAVASRQEHRFWDPATDPAELASLRQHANTLGYTSAGLGAVAVGSGIAAVVIGSW